MDSINLDALFISLFVLGWLLSAGLAWLVLAATRRGRGALPTLPAALACGCLAALLLPAIGFRDGRALALSFPIAALGGLLGAFAVLGAGAMMVHKAQASQSGPVAPASGSTARIARPPSGQDQGAGSGRSSRNTETTMDNE